MTSKVGSYMNHIHSLSLCIIYYYIAVVTNENARPARWNCSPSVSEEEEMKQVYVIDIYPQVDQDDMHRDIGVSMYFSHTPTYPDSFPRVHVSSIRGLSTEHIEQCCNHVTAAMEEHAGLPMIYTLVEVAQEWINALEDGAQEALRADDPAVLEQKRRQEEEERIQKLRAHGHEVTPESFRAWKEQFLLEQQEKQEHAGVKATSTMRNTMTGKQWFLQQQGEAGKEEEEVEEYEDEIPRDDIEDDVFDSDDSDLEETILGELYEELVEQS